MGCKSRKTLARRQAAGENRKSVQRDKLKVRQASSVKKKGHSRQEPKKSGMN